MAKLYEITGRYLELEKLSDDEGQSMSEAIKDTMDSIEGEFNDKAVGLVRVMNNIDSELEEIKREIDRLTLRKKVFTNKQENMKDYLRHNMESTGIKKISCPLFTITCGEGRDVVEVKETDEIPDEYMVVKTEIKPDKKKILNALNSGVHVPGVVLAKSRSSIIIR